ncbi:efflux RND transporter periplasmic adaptor subunit [Stratiformator vulcanicus]|uniref:p-hydroxybenzoic acid efflux subunit AaeA n=1 Tax=Stratiformator vulcanicus TaxID=2527980 RepID=A0A517QZ88_9PLAN|nr:HlyD family efflux transporter periplasmic adaptor subunit [Stratiformator vulcanicus]QDT36951.1 p-hydroxybenzoic acid efflux subunit AaeA [Stratiformator vulcanicus]
MIFAEDLSSDIPTEAATVKTILCVFALVQFAVVASASEPITIPECSVRPDERAVLASGQPGVIAEVKVSEGDRVDVRELLVRLFDDEAKAALAAAAKQADNDVSYRYAVKAAELSQVEYEKVLEGNRRTPGTFPDIEVRRLKLDAERARLEIEQAQHEQAMAKLSEDEAAARLKLMHVRAPFGGFVTHVMKSEGEAVQDGSPILELISTRKVKVEGAVDVHLLPRINPGQRVEVRVEDPLLAEILRHPVLEGEIVFVDTQVQPVDPKVRVWARVDNPDNRIPAGVLAVMTILNEEPASTEDGS